LKCCYRFTCFTPFTVLIFFISDSSLALSSTVTVSINGGIKIHRCDCPNAKEMRSRFPYRIVKARWAGKSQGKQYPITLRIIGHDDIGIVTNITSIINKENNILLRSISIDSHDGLFSGMLTVTVDDNAKLESLIKKIKTVKGVKQVNR
jgi:GTP diphosphokinase / guanosine-3',5'-bis(diphosphate) 3'-diphosphatase